MERKEGGQGVGRRRGDSGCITNTPKMRLLHTQQWEAIPGIRATRAPTRGSYTGGRGREKVVGVGKEGARIGLGRGV